MDKNIAVIGLGTMGRTICETLVNRGASVLAIDNSIALVDKVKTSVEKAIVMDTSDSDAINQAPLDNIDIAIVTIGDSIEDNILTTTLLKQKKIPYIISRALNPTHSQVLRQLGADKIINVEEDYGNQLAEELMNPYVIGKVSINDDYIIQEISVEEIPMKVTNKFFANHNIQICAIQREDDLILINDIEDIQPNDVLFCLGSKSNFNTLFQDISRKS
ncbi:potassium channel family protein [Spirochaeta cellobiosiphila]|uniref:potassium channel family protein n=1 Tax=Spirochaeta cellobiosiphila TaxID=504483 RepID=UPI0003F91205|nr:TrkA family potassium uptake protein [Spirochaeta cellobiosiphila]